MESSTFHLAAAITLVAFMAASSVLAQTDAGNIEMKAPFSGWRNSTGGEPHYAQDVHYPAMSVSTPQEQGVASMIAGRIRNQPKAAAATEENKSRRHRGAGGSSVGTLIVNSVAMPQCIRVDGAFLRPYTFDVGGNNVGVRSVRGDAKCVQFCDSYAGKQCPCLRVVLSWDTDGTDLDLHVISPDGQRAWYGNHAVESGGALDVDITTGCGPEIYPNPAPVPSTYLVYVNYYDSGSDNSAITTVTVSIITNESTPSECQQTFVVPMHKADDLTLLRDFTMK